MTTCFFICICTMTTDKYEISPNESQKIYAYCVDSIPITSYSLNISQEMKQFLEFAIMFAIAFGISASAFSTIVKGNDEHSRHVGIHLKSFVMKDLFGNNAGN